jgi:hypothetical protein
MDEGRSGADEGDEVGCFHGIRARASFIPKLLSLCVDIPALTCENIEEGKVFLHRKFPTMTGYDDGSLRWSAHVARRHDVGAREGPGQRRGWRTVAK